jgi:uncharacterized protein (TIGR02679 family)
MERLREVLGQPGLARMVQRLRRRVLSGLPLDGRLILTHPTEEEREAVYRLMGAPQRRRSASLSVSLPELAQLLREAELSSGLEDAVERLTGPLENPKAMRRADWEALEGELTSLVPPLHDFVRSTWGRRWLRRGDPVKLRAVVPGLSRVAERLPAAGITLAELAARATGDAHSLDLHRPLGGLAVRLAASLGGLDPTDPTLDRRTAWARVGVLCDELSAPVLTLNLQAEGGRFADEALRLHARAGEPYRLSLRQLLREPPVFSRQGVYVCENPMVLATAADRLGASCRALVCVEGQPRSAATILLGMLGEFRYHGDFDWAGIRIANRVMGMFPGARPWRYGVVDYERACPDGSTLSGIAVEASWDRELRPAMKRARKAVHEEQVLSELLDDLTS